MKKLLALILALAMALCLTACGGAEAPAPETEPESSAEPAAEPEPAPEPEPSPAPEAKEVMGVTVPAFTVMVGETAVTNDMMADYAVYEVQATSVNSAGTESTTTYIGFAVADLLAAAGVSDYTTVSAIADDGYTIEYAAEVAGEPTTLVAISKDGEQFKSGPWFAPCTSGTTGDYLKGLASISVDGGAVGEAPAAEGEEPAEAAAPEIQDKTDKVEFADFKFLVNGAEVTNATMEGASIFKITVSVVNKSGEAAEATYTGYKLADVLAAAGIADFSKVTIVANDGYETEMDAETAASEYTLVAIEKDKETGEDGTIWVAPCLAAESSAYSKLVVEIKAE